MAERFMTDKTGRRRALRWFCHAAKGNQIIQKQKAANAHTEHETFLLSNDTNPN
jgi:hypothetical protein